MEQKDKNMHMTASFSIFPQMYLLVDMSEIVFILFPVCQHTVARV